MYSAQVTPAAGSTVYVPLSCNINITPATSDPTNEANDLMGYVTKYADPTGGNAGLGPLEVECDDPPGGGESISVAVVRNTSVSALSLTISGDSNKKASDTGVLQPATGDLLALKIDASSGYSGGNVTIGVGYTSGG